MELRSGTVVGKNLLRQDLRPAFEEAASLCFRRWTALTLAVENQWGGTDSANKADWLIHESIGWFYSKKEHYADELEEELDDALLNEFNAQIEDGSSAELAKTLVTVYNEFLEGNLSALDKLRAAAAAAPAAAAAAKSKKQVVDRDGAVMADGEDNSSGSDSDGEGSDAMDEDKPSRADAGPRRLPPVVDEDGFTMVQTRRTGRQ